MGRDTTYVPGWGPPALPGSGGGGGGGLGEVWVHYLCLCNIVGMFLFGIPFCFGIDLSKYLRLFRRQTAVKM